MTEVLIHSNEVEVKNASQIPQAATINNVDFFGYANGQHKRIPISELEKKLISDGIGSQSKYVEQRVESGVAKITVSELDNGYFLYAMSAVSTIQLLSSKDCHFYFMFKAYGNSLSFISDIDFFYENVSITAGNIYFAEIISIERVMYTMRIAEMTQIP